ncbi:MAG TPA: DUF1653 domain-containing protein [Candidatus Saccharimonadales bacterium]|nr:DUF1653 domain-containing protein [Candidatus Saccharimonadales bacterium]
MNSNTIGPGLAPAHEYLSQDQLADRLATAQQQVMAGARYMHYKQHIYKVLAVALLEADNEPCVVYQAEYGEAVTWVRPVSSWMQTVTVDGKTVPRFTKLDA